MSEYTAGPTQGPADEGDDLSVYFQNGMAELEKAMQAEAALSDAGRRGATVGTITEPAIPVDEPVLPDWARSRDSRTAAIRQARATAKHRIAFHGIRLPLYAGRIALLAGYGAVTASHSALHYTLAWEYNPAIRDAKRAKDGARVLTLRDEKTQVAKDRQHSARTWLAGGSAGLYVTIAVATATVGSWIIAGPMAIMLIAALASYGHRHKTGHAQTVTLFDTAPTAPNLLTSAELAEAVRNAGVIPKSDQRDITIAGVIGREPSGASVVDFELPPGITAKALLSRVGEFASALGKGVGQLDITTYATNERRVQVHISDDLPFTEDVEGGPLLDLVRNGKAFDFFAEIPVGITLRGLIKLMPSLIGESLLIGGEPNGGKSVAAFCVLLAAALDPTTRLWLIDGKGIGGNLKRLAPLADVYDDTRKPAAFAAILDRLEEEFEKRRQLLNRLGEEKVTKKLAEKYPELAPLVFFIDELKEYTNHFDPAIAKEFKQRLISFVSLARAVGIITIACTQKPSTDVVPSSLRDLITYRWALRCATPEASKTIIKSGHGYSAHTIESEQKGAGFIHAGGKAPVKIRSHFYTTAQIIEIIALATTLRQQAGTLPEATVAALTGTITLIRQAFEQADAKELRSTDLAKLLHQLAPDADWAQRDDEKDRAWQTRVGSRLKTELSQALGRPVESVPVVGDDGKKGQGFRITDLT